MIKEHNVFFEIVIRFLKLPVFIQMVVSSKVILPIFQYGFFILIDFYNDLKLSFQTISKSKYH